MSYRFRAMGPYYFSTVPDRRKKLKIIDPLACRDEVFAAAEADASRIGISNIYTAVGLYVMGLKTSDEWPYYVGQTSASLYRRVFQPIDKPIVYGSIINEYKRAKPFIYLLPLVTAAGNQVELRGGKIGARPKKVIDHAEKNLIGQALHINPGLYNIMCRAEIESYVIDGTPSAPRHETKDAKNFRSMMGHSLNESDQARQDKLTRSSVQAIETAKESAKDFQELVPESNAE